MLPMRGFKRAGIEAPIRNGSLDDEQLLNEHAFERQ